MLIFQKISKVKSYQPVKMTYINKTDTSFTLCAGVAIDCAIFATPSPFLPEFSVFELLWPKYLIVKNNNRYCYQSETFIRKLQVRYQTLFFWLSPLEIKANRENHELRTFGKQTLHNSPRPQVLKRFRWVNQCYDYYNIVIT